MCPIRDVRVNPTFHSESELVPAAKSDGVDAPSPRGGTSTARGPRTARSAGAFIAEWRASESEDRAAAPEHSIGPCRMAGPYVACMWTGGWVAHSVKVPVRRGALTHLPLPCHGFLQ